MAKDKKVPGVTRVTFNTDSDKIPVDLGALYCISSEKKDFEGEIVPTKRTIDGIAAGLPATGIRMIKWSIQYDQGRVHHIRIPNLLLVPKSPIRILSPQHWAQSVDNHVPIMSSVSGTKKYRGKNAAKQSLRCDNPKQSVCFTTVCRNSTNTHNLLIDTTREETSELAHVDKTSTEIEEEVNVQANAVKNSTETSTSDNGVNKPYTKSFKLNQQGFERKEHVFHDLEAQENSAELL